MLMVALTNHRHNRPCSNAWFCVFTVSKNRQLKGYKTPFREWNTLDRVECGLTGE